MRNKSKAIRIAWYTRILFMTGIFLAIFFIGFIAGGVVWHYGDPTPIPGSHPVNDSTNTLLDSSSIGMPGGDIKHSCSFKYCPMAKSQVFESDCEEGSDCYETDVVHWQHPELTTDEIEDIVFCGKKVFK